MSCFYPVECYRALRPNQNGKRPLFHGTFKAAVSHFGGRHNFTEFYRNCGYCIECRLQKSAGIAIRCVHTAASYEQNCFLTLTYDDEHLPADLSLSTEVMQNFWKRLRDRICTREGRRVVHRPLIKYYASGEYGEQAGTREINPHYHACLFNWDFADKKYFKKTGSGEKLYTSDLLSDLWPYGFAGIGDVTFQSAAYVARYTMAKVYGDDAAEHYNGRLPEKSWSSQGLGKEWIEKYVTSVYPHDYVVNEKGMKIRPPAYYDRYLEANYPELWSDILDERSGAKINNNKINFDLKRVYKDGRPSNMIVSDIVRRAQYRVNDKKERLNPNVVC